jgi:hypothetical protein
MMVYVLQDALAEAQAVYETLEGLPADAAGRPYADLAVAFWEEYSAGGDVTSACARVVEHAGTQPGDILIPLGSGFYGYHTRDYVAEEICPFQ